jgi:hypothetical protein
VSHPPADTSEIINDRQAKDARIRIERNYHRCLEARNTDAREAELAALNYGGGCLAYSCQLRHVTWPATFRPSVPVKYDKTSNPRYFFQVYTTAMVAAGANE